MTVKVVGAGLAGCECAHQLATHGVDVVLVEQKPGRRTPAQRTDAFAELVCSNSLRGTALENAVGLLKEELRRAGSLVMWAAERARVPAGGALAVDRDLFSAEITARLRAHPRIRIEAAPVEAIPADRPVVLATGPLTGDALAADLARVIGEEHLAYYDAIAPVVDAETIDWERVFRASRYDKGGDDAYVNCPMDEAQYHAFVAAVVAADQVAPRDFEDPRYFEGCLPLEVMAERGPMTLAYGCMKPVGLVDPRTGRRPFAVVQLRQENRAATAYNLVGFQTRMTHDAQRRILRMIPGLEHAELLRLGSVHRNTFVRAPEVLDDLLSLRALPGVHLAGQITGVEGYVESAACGLVLGLRLAAREQGRALGAPPPETALGALMGHVRAPRADFQPSNVVWSMFPPAERGAPGKGGRRGRRARRGGLADRALSALGPWLEAASASGTPEAPAPAGDRGTAGRAQP